MSRLQPRVCVARTDSSAKADSVYGLERERGAIAIQFKIQNVQFKMKERAIAVVSLRLVW